MSILQVVLIIITFACRSVSCKTRILTNPRKAVGPKHTKIHNFSILFLVD